MYTKQWVFNKNGGTSHLCLFTKSYFYFRIEMA